MEDYILIFISIIMAGILMFTAPTVIMANRVDDTIQTVVDEAATSFVDRTRAQGYITYNDYYALLTSLEGTHHTYNVNITLDSSQYYSDTSAVRGYANTYASDTYREITSEIIAAVQAGTDSKYYMKTGDYLKIQIEQTDRSIGSRFMQLFSGTRNAEIFVRYGGRVGNEDI